MKVMNHSSRRNLDQKKVNENSGSKGAEAKNVEPKVSDRLIFELIIINLHNLARSFGPLST